MDTGSVTAVSEQWSEPVFITAVEVGESVEFIYKQSLLITYTTYQCSDTSERVFKIVFSCKDGKWNKSEPIYGSVIPASEESYYFE